MCCQLSCFYENKNDDDDDEIGWATRTGNGSTMLATVEKRQKDRQT